MIGPEDTHLTVPPKVSNDVLVHDKHGRWYGHFNWGTSAWEFHRYTNREYWSNWLGWNLSGAPRHYIGRFFRQLTCPEHLPSAWMVMGTVRQLTSGERPTMVRLCEYCGKEIERVSKVE